MGAGTGMTDTIAIGEALAHMVGVGEEVHPLIDAEAQAHIGGVAQALTAGEA